jgi:uncharacterized repeat protein (TIGR03803 family)
MRYSFILPCFLRFSAFQPLNGFMRFRPSISNGGASGCGTVFKLDAKGKLTVLHTFTGGSDGGNPDSVVLDGAGNLYGTAATGGRCRDQGCGVVFNIAL